VSPYINNLHPTKRQALYSTTEDVVAGFIPMFQCVLDEIDAKKRLAWPASGRVEFNREYCLSDEEDEEEEQKDDSSDSRKRPPDAKTYAGELEKSLLPASLRGRTVQCIIKLSNTHLTPEQPKYEGDTWHVEGTEIDLFGILRLILPQEWQTSRLLPPESTQAFSLQLYP
jgi:hypothetical protein